MSSPLCPHHRVFQLVERFALLAARPSGSAEPDLKPTFCRGAGELHVCELLEVHELVEMLRLRLVRVSV